MEDKECQRLEAEIQSGMETIELHSDKEGNVSDVRIQSSNQQHAKANGQSSDDVTAAESSPAPNKSNATKVPSSDDSEVIKGSGGVSPQSQGLDQNSSYQRPGRSEVQNAEVSRGRKSRNSRRIRSRSQTPFTRHHVSIYDSNDDDSGSEGGYDGNDDTPTTVTVHYAGKALQKCLSSSPQLEDQGDCEGEDAGAHAHKENVEKFAPELHTSRWCDDQAAGEPKSPAVARRLPRNLSRNRDKNEAQSSSGRNSFALRSTRRSKRQTRKRSQTPFHRNSLNISRDDNEDVNFEENDGAACSELKSRGSVRRSQSYEKRKVRFCGEDTAVQKDEESMPPGTIKRRASSVSFNDQYSSGTQTGGKYSREELVRRLMSTVTSDGENEREEPSATELDMLPPLSSLVSFAEEPEIINGSGGNDHMEIDQDARTSYGTSEGIPASSPRGRQSMAGFKISRRDKTPFKRLVLSFNDLDDEAEDVGVLERSDDSVYGKSSLASTSERSTKDSSSASCKTRVTFSERASCDEVMDSYSSPRGRQRNSTFQRAKRDQTPFNPKCFEMPSSDEEDNGAPLAVRQASSRAKPSGMVRFAEEQEHIDSHGKIEREPCGSSLRTDSRSLHDARGRPMTPRGKIKRRSATPFFSRNDDDDWAATDNEYNSSECDAEETSMWSSSMQGAGNGGTEIDERQKLTLSEPRPRNFERGSQTTSSRDHGGKFEKGTQTSMLVEMTAVMSESWSRDNDMHLGGDHSSRGQHGSDGDGKAAGLMSVHHSWAPAAAWALAHVFGIGMCILASRRTN